MRITIKKLRELIRSTIIEAGGGISPPRQPFDGAHSVYEREPLGALTTGEPDDDIAPHLRGSFDDEDLDDKGPVPPNSETPGVYKDPFVRGDSVLGMRR